MESVTILFMFSGYGVYRALIDLISLFEPKKKDNREKFLDWVIENNFKKYPNEKLLYWSTTYKTKVVTEYGVTYEELYNIFENEKKIN